MKRDMMIYIPTYKRVNKQKTFSDIPDVWKENTLLVANAEESAILREKGYPVLEHPPEITTIALKRAWIIQQCPAEKLFMMDDDMYLYGRKPGVLALERALMTEERRTRLLDEVQAKLDDYAHVGISPRQNNNTFHGLWRECSRMVFTLGYRTKVVREEVEFNRVHLKEDFDYTLQLLRKGYKNVVGYEHCTAPDGFHAPGGCSAEERTLEATNQSALDLARLHPEFVKVVERDYDKSMKRLEVIVQWKKAYQSSQKAT